MKKLLLLLLIAPVLGYGQGEQRYADGTATDQDGNVFEWINYGDLDWAIEDAEVVTYRDGTSIPQVTDGSTWSNLTTGAWCYYNNDPTKGRLYNWYAVMGIHDNDESTPNKDFAAVGWRVPTDGEWTTFQNYLIANGYNYDGSTAGNKIAKAMASTTGWYSSVTPGEVGYDQHLNNSSGFNVFPRGFRRNGSFYNVDFHTYFWTSNKHITNDVWNRYLKTNGNFLVRYLNSEQNGYSVRFLRDASTASTNDYSNAITIYPNPTTSILTIEGNKEYDIEVYDMAGNKVMALTGNTIDMSHLSSATYIVKALDKVENEKLTYKIVKN
jgi:uncharacterized protein (TIGR02145 family)